jgi:hypothetical protein
MKTKNMKIEELYPIKFEGKEYNEEDCDPTFVANYFHPFTYIADVGVRITSQDVVDPNGNIFEW